MCRWCLIINVKNLIQPSTKGIFYCGRQQHISNSMLTHLSIKPEYEPTNCCRNMNIFVLSTFVISFNTDIDPMRTAKWEQSAIDVIDSIKLYLYFEGWKYHRLTHTHPIIHVWEMHAMRFAWEILYLESRVHSKTSINVCWFEIYLLLLWQWKLHSTRLKKEKGLRIIHSLISTEHKIENRVCCAWWRIIILRFPSNINIRVSEHRHCLYSSQSNLTAYHSVYAEGPENCL